MGNRPCEAVGKGEEIGRGKIQMEVLKMEEIDPRDIEREWSEFINGDEYIYLDLATGPTVLIEIRRTDGTTYRQ